MRTKSKYKEKNIFITGISGFIGEKLAQRLTDLGMNVYGVSRSKKGKNILSASILDYKEMLAFIKQYHISACIHLAGEPLVETGQEDPYNTFKLNTEGALNILEIARVQNLEKVIIASSSHVYGNNKLPYREVYTPKPSRPYETSKACTDLIAQSYVDTFNLPVLIPRFVNIYGPGDIHYTRLIPKTIKSVINGENPIMWGGSAIRDYLFIDDAISAYIKLLDVSMERVGKNRIFNFGSSNLISVRELIEKIILISGNDLKIKKTDEQREQEIKAQYVSWTKAKNILGWKPQVSLDLGLQKTVLWYNDYIQNSKR